MQLKKFSNHSFKAPGKAHNVPKYYDNPKIEAPMDCCYYTFPIPSEHPVRVTTDDKEM
jgi:hypothetical protein